VPLATTVKLAVAPRVTAALAGWVVMAGAAGGAGGGVVLDELPQAASSSAIEMASRETK
jgi:hypothetical protein